MQAHRRQEPRDGDRVELPNPTIDIPFNKPYLSGREIEYIEGAVASGKISGDGEFTHRCHHFFEHRFGFRKALLTTSGTDALEMAALLIDVQPGDEIILPSYTFVSTANAFVLRGAAIVFADSSASNPNIDAQQIESLITPRTKAIVPVHYAGVACDMSEITAVAQRHDLFVIEDAAHAIDSYHNARPLGSVGHLAAFSFHETKNLISGEGGMLVVNDERFLNRAEVIREKGTNRAALARREVDKYEWLDLGSSFLPSELIAAFLWAQLQCLDRIQARRKAIWQRYWSAMEPLAARGEVGLPNVPPYATNNGHMFYLVTRDSNERSALIGHLRDRGILAVFHYLSLHRSPFFRPRHDGRALPYADAYSERLVRLPLYYELDPPRQQRVVDAVLDFYGRCAG